MVPGDCVEELVDCAPDGVRPLMRRAAGRALP
ncbi:hypothetical protein HMPREF9452_01415 [Collinsella tanakaei YIT 12063]|uniref:Uncharacterized protein n=1 Tax=Collinsella tanakaei YIT 12063 TaxID=742742 RepID=G1WJA2_9ACTN|nr:hypothetical protein HMPREF9452_01415 [Collinsella tanakaei YIT 12063]